MKKVNVVMTKSKWRGKRLINKIFCINCSFVEMESVSMNMSVRSSDLAVAAEPSGKSLNATRSKKRKRTTPSMRDFIPDSVTGVFLKSVFYLNPECSKYAIVAIFQNFCNSSGVLVNGKKGFAYWSPNVFNQLQIHFNDVTLALNDPKGVRRFGLQNGSGEDCSFRR